MTTHVASSRAPFFGYLLHLGYNMWMDRPMPEIDLPHYAAQPFLRCDKSLWDDLLPRMADAGINLVVVDLGDGVRYESHPEIAVDGAWSVDALRTELDRMRGMGLEPIPKLNFSTCHDTWLGPYARMVSTPLYYDVCRDLIAEAMELFDAPRYFHLGMDEEDFENQKHHAYVVIRQYDLWWHDLMFYVEQVQARGARPWVWSDYIWRHPETFRANMPRSVLQSNWYYYSDFGGDDAMLRAFDQLEEAGYDQAATGSNWSDPGNFEGVVRYAREHIAPERLLGFLQTVWKPTLESERERHLDAIAQVARARQT